MINVALGDLGTMAAIVAGIVGSYWALIKVVANQFTKGLNERFKAQDEARDEGRKQYLENIAKLEERVRTMENKLIEVLISLPRDYTRREDHVQAVASIMVKIENLALRTEQALREISKGGKE